MLSRQQRPSPRRKSRLGSFLLAERISPRASASAERDVREEFSESGVALRSSDCRLRGARQKVKRPHRKINSSRSVISALARIRVLERLLGAREFGSREFLGFSRRRRWEPARGSPEVASDCSQLRARQSSPRWASAGTGSDRLGGPAPWTRFSRLGAPRTPVAGSWAVRRSPRRGERRTRVKRRRASQPSSAVARGRGSFDGSFGGGEGTNPPFTARVQRRLASHAQRAAASVASRGSAPSGRAARDFGSAEISGLEVRRPRRPSRTWRPPPRPGFARTALALRRETTARSTRASGLPRTPSEGATPNSSPPGSSRPLPGSGSHVRLRPLRHRRAMRRLRHRAQVLEARRRRSVPPRPRGDARSRLRRAALPPRPPRLSRHTAGSRARWSLQRMPGTVENLLEDCGKVIRHLERRVETLQAEVRETEAEARAAMETNATDANATDSDSSERSSGLSRRRRRGPPPENSTPLHPRSPHLSSPTRDAHVGVLPTAPRGAWRRSWTPPARVPIAEDDWKRLEWPGVRIVAEYPNAPRAPPRPAPTPPPPFVPPVCVPLPSPPVAPDGWGDGVRPKRG